MNKLRALNRIGRKGVLLILAGLAWISIGIALTVNQRDRFSAPGPGTDRELQLLDSPWLNIVWVACGFVGLFVGLFRDRKIVYNHDAVGFNAILIPPLMTTFFFAWSAGVYIATGGAEGSPFSFFSFIVWFFSSFFIMVVAGWPEAYNSYHIIPILPTDDDIPSRNDSE